MQKWGCAKHALKQVNAIVGFIHHRRLPGLALGWLGSTASPWPCEGFGLMVPIVLVDEVFGQVQVGDVIPDIMF